MVLPVSGSNSLISSISSPKKLTAPRGVLIVRREDLEAVAAHPEIAAREGLVVAPVLQRDELADDLALVLDRALLQAEGHRRIGLDRADAVEAARPRRR